MPYTPFANDAYTYDAAGNVNTVTSSSSTVLGQDGDGRQVKSTETVTDPQSGQTTTTTRYYVRSTVLGGAVLTEMELTNNYTLHGPLGVVEASARASAPRLVSYSVSLYHGRLTRDFGLNLDKALNEGIEQGNLTRNWIVSDNWALDYGLFPQQPIMTGFSLGPHANFTYGEQSILKQVYDRITQKDCVDFVNGVLAENKVSKDLNELWKLTNKAVLNKWDSGLTAQGLGISQAEFTRIQNGFEGKGLAVTMSDRTRIYLGDRMFLREGNDSPFKIWSSFTNIDTAGHLVHELFHIAGISHPEGQGFDFDAEIHKNCGLAKTNW